MIRRVRHRIERLRVPVLAGVGLMVAGLGVAVVPATVAQALPDECAETLEAVAGAGDNFEELCLLDAEVAAMDDSDAVLDVGEVASSPNMRLLENIPKQGAFANESSFNSDLAFQGDYAFAGNYDGFTVYDVRDPREPEVVTQVLCPGAQNDVSVHGDLLFLSVDSSRNNDSCNSTTGPLSDPSSWEGIRVFDISDVANPQYVKSVRTDCGSHTHTLVPGQDGDNVYVYVSSYNPNAAAAYCTPPHDKISIIKVPTDAPAEAAVVATPVLFPDGGHPGGNGSRATTGCHDITAYPEKDIAAGACMGDGVLLDISDRENPVVTEQVRDTTNFAFWHSATFNNEGTKVVFTDELGGGGAPTCNPTVGPTRGANGIYDIEGGDLVFQSYYKIPRTQSNTENCVAHNGSLIPVAGKDIMVQAWYQGGVSVFDFTDSANPVEIAWFDRGPLSDERLILGGSWSAYYYNGFVISNDIQQGLDVFEVRDPRVAPARRIRFDEFNPQTQPSYRG